MVYFRGIKSFLVWDAGLPVTVKSRQCLDMTVGKIGNGLERGFVKHRLNCLLISDPYFKDIYGTHSTGFELHFSSILRTL